MRDEVKSICRRLPASEGTIRFLSPFLAKKHIQNGIDDRMKTYYGSFCFFRNILAGKTRAYGVFETDEKYAAALLEARPHLKNIYNEETGHKMMMFHLEDATAVDIPMMGPGASLL